MGIKYRKTNTTFETLAYTSRVTTPSLCYRKNNTTYYVPLLLNGDSAVIGDYEYSTGIGPSLCCRYNNKMYKAAKSRTLVSVDIPAGTYTPTAFENLIRQFISDNSYRTTANSFTVTVNNQTITIPAGTTIKFRTSAAGSGTTSSLRAVMFGADVGNTVPAAASSSSSGFTNLKSYVTYATNYGGNCTWSGFQYYNITVGGNGIKFV